MWLQTELIFHLLLHIAIRQVKQGRKLWEEILVFRHLYADWLHVLLHLLNWPLTPPDLFTWSFPLLSGIEKEVDTSADYLIIWSTDQNHKHEMQIQGKKHTDYKQYCGTHHNNQYNSNRSLTIMRPWKTRTKIVVLLKVKQDIWVTCDMWHAGADG